MDVVILFPFTKNLNENCFGVPINKSCQFSFIYHLKKADFVDTAATHLSRLDTILFNINHHYIMAYDDTPKEIFESFAMLFWESLFKTWIENLPSA